MYDQADILAPTVQEVKQLLIERIEASQKAIEVLSDEELESFANGATLDEAVDLIVNMMRDQQKAAKEARRKRFIKGMIAVVGTTIASGIIGFSVYKAKRSGE